MHFINFDSYATAKEHAAVIVVWVETVDGKKVAYRMPIDAHDQLIDDIAAMTDQKGVITFWDRHASSMDLYTFHSIKRISVTYQGG